MGDKGEERNDKVWHRHIRRKPAHLEEERCSVSGWLRLQNPSSPPSRPRHDVRVLSCSSKYISAVRKTRRADSARIVFIALTMSSVIGASGRMPSRLAAPSTCSSRYSRSSSVATVCSPVYRSAHLAQHRCFARTHPQNPGDKINQHSQHTPVCLCLDHPHDLAHRQRESCIGGRTNSRF